MSLKDRELVIGKRVMVPDERVPDRRPWAERYGVIVGVDQFLDCRPWVSVRLDGETAYVLSFRPEELEVE